MYYGLRFRACPALVRRPPRSSGLQPLTMGRLPPNYLLPDPAEPEWQSARVGGAEAGKRHRYQCIPRHHVGVN